MAKQLVKLLDVNAPVLDAYGEIWEEPKVAKGKVELLSGELKPLALLKQTDEFKVEAVSIGKAIVTVLDIPDEKLEAGERANRFFLATRIASAMKDGKPFEMDREDEKRIEEASGLSKSFMVTARIREALSRAEVPKPTIVAAE